MRALIGPEPFCGVSRCLRSASIKLWMQDRSREWWVKTPGQRQAKKFIHSYSPKLTAELLQLGRVAIRIAVGILAGHCRLNKHMHCMGLATDSLCRFCQEEEETALHVVCQCEGLVWLRYRLFGKEKLVPTSLSQGPLSDLLRLLRYVRVHNFKILLSFKILPSLLVRKLTKLLVREKHFLAITTLPPPVPSSNSSASQPAGATPQLH
uniref:Reverse transcriptase zinc-binding domain-containing protein n=1 Tax=Rhodnius prolixus TaxID=13249 RepID=T1I9C7_RHOPR